MISYRIAETRDRAFIVSAWSSSYRESHTAGLIAMSDWADVMHAQIAKVLDRADCTTVVATWADGEGNGVVDLVGFIAADVTDRKPLVFYAYVKHAYRRSGIARGLFHAVRVDPAKQFRYACSTEALAVLRREGKLPLARWDPLAARYPKETSDGRNEA